MLPTTVAVNNHVQGYYIYNKNSDCRETKSNYLDTNCNDTTSIWFEFTYNFGNGLKISKPYSNPRSLLN